MRITVFGATGRIGSEVVALLRADGHDVVPASLSTGADVVTGAGLADSLSGADVLVDVVNSPSFADGPVSEFFTAAALNLTVAARAAGVGHHVALSIVGCDELPDSGYMRAKAAQERIIAESGLPYTIVRATQFDEFAEAIVESLIVGAEVRVPDGSIQPIAAADVAAEVAARAVAEPAGGVVNIGGPDRMSFADLARTVLAHQHRRTPVVIDPQATYFGTRIDDTSLVTGAGAVIAGTPLAAVLAPPASD